MTPVDAVLALTYRCNARCAMCGIWKTDPVQESPPGLYRKLPPTLRNINLTGGEPYLRQDLPAVHAACRAAAPRARTVVSTNGILTDRIIRATREMAKNESHIGVAVSIDGPPEIHDRIRGIDGAFDNAMRTVKELQAAGITNLRLAFTAGPENVAHMSEIYALARENDVQFTCAVEHASEHYFHSSARPEKLPLDALRAQLLVVMRAELRALSPKKWARAYFMRGLHEFVAGHGRLLPCRAGFDHFFMDPVGELYACNAAPYSMGNLNQNDFDILWRSDQAASARDKVARCSRGCWMVCTARTSIKAHWLRVLIWALKAKLFGVSLGGRS